MKNVLQKAGNVPECVIIVQRLPTSLLVCKPERKDEDFTREVK
jgi:hypothetical protein